MGKPKQNLTPERLCEVCDEEIVADRIAAMPAAKRCIHCEEVRERKWGVRVRSMEVITSSTDAESFEGAELFFTRDRLRKPRPK